MSSAGCLSDLNGDENGDDGDDGEPSAGATFSVTITDAYAE
ncbi:hypothetical protein OB905_00405 [Halobacteria archaeon AArc-dxtr1]|nr:hypothetical protein [Halobacteria archaeon AArc-dxtr1]